MRPAAWVLENLWEKAKEYLYLGKSTNKSGDLLRPFPTVSPDDLIGCMKIPEKKLLANRKQGNLLGLLATMSHINGTVA
jgi:hypothetical protein